jgi:hypothetical protein
MVGSSPFSPTNLLEQFHLPPSTSMPCASFEAAGNALADLETG